MKWCQQAVNNMPEITASLQGKVALVTGAAKRLGAATASLLHHRGANVLIHYHTSEFAAMELVDKLNAIRADSAGLIGTELGTREQCEHCVARALEKWNRLDIVINNASRFFPTPIGDIDDSTVAQLMQSNFTAPLFIAQAAFQELSLRHGAIVNMADIHAYKAYENHSVYCAAKAALVMLTQSLAMELAPHVRVNAIAPGAILWPEDGSMSEEQQQQNLNNIPLRRCGTPDDIAELVASLCSSASGYVTGEIIKVDGGRSL